MTDREFLIKIKELKNIKPQRDWVVFCKKEIFKEEEKFSIVSLFHPVKFASQLFNRVKPAYIVSVVLILVLGITSLFVLKDRLIKNEVLVKPQITPNQEIVLALKELQTEINNTTAFLKETKEIKEPQRILEVRNSVIPFIEEANKTLNKLEELELEQNIKTESNILAIKESVDRFQNAYRLIEAEVAKNLIEFLKQRTLTESQQEILKQAKKDFEQGNYNKALINAMLIQQMME